ncbi:MAG: DLW-39 family protein [Dehalococcoidia bacterium]
MKKLLMMLTAAGAALFFWRRRTEPSKREQAMNRAKAGIAAGVERSRSAADFVKHRIEEQRARASDAGETDAP